MNTYILAVINIAIAIAIVSSLECEDSIDWQTVSGALVQVSVGSDGTVYGINDDDSIYRYNGDNSWTLLAEGRLTQIDVASSSVIWGVNSDDSIYAKNGDDSWSAIGGLLEHVEVASDGTVYGVNSGDSIYRYNSVGGGWTRISGKLEQISVGSAANIWGRNDGQNIYKLDTQSNPNTWELIPGALTYVSVSADNTVMGVNENDEIFRYNADQNSWTLICGGLVQIEVGSATEVWGINKHMQIYKGIPNYEKSSIISISFDFESGGIDMSSVTPLAVGTAICDNEDGGSTDKVITFQVSEDIQETSSFSHSEGFEISVGTKFSAGVPEIASGEISTSLTVSSEWTWGEEKSVTQHYGATFEVSCAPSEIIQGDATISTATFSVPYTMKLQTIGGNIIHYSYGIWTGTSSWELLLDTTKLN